VNSQLDWLDNQIDLMLAGKRPQPFPDYLLKDERGEYLAVLQVAAQLNGLRPGAVCPDAAFLTSLLKSLERTMDHGDDRR